MWSSALQHFQSVDPILFSAASAQEEIILAPQGEAFSELCSIIVQQQLSVKAGDTIWQRVRALLQNTVTPVSVLATEGEAFRTAGMSRSKALFLHDLANRVHTRELNLDTLIQQTEDEIWQELQKVKGIGPWSVEMFLMFSLGRPDVFSAGDLGLRRAIEKLYHIESATREDLLRISAPWAPYRTYASRVLWRSLDNSPL